MALCTISFPAVALVPAAPGGAVFIILPGATATSATVAMQMPNGVPIPIGTLNPTTGKFTAVGLGQPNGVASLGPSGTVPPAQLPIGTTSGTVASGARACDIAGATDCSGASVTPTNGATAASIASQLPPNSWEISRFGAAGDGVTDDSGALKNALAACSAKGGGAVYLDDKRYYIGANVTVPQACAVACRAPLYGNPSSTDYTKLTSVALLNPSYTITMSPQSGWSKCSVLNSNINFNPVTTRDELNIVAAFAGTAFTVPNADVTIEDSLIGGFAVGVSDARARGHLRNLNIDATSCLRSTNSHDISHFYSIHCFPFLSSANANTTVGYPISGIANNGNGLYRVTLSTPTVAQTGDTVWVTGATGAQSANNRWTATVVDATHIDLQGSSATGVSLTGSCYSNSYGLVLQSIANIGIGSTLTGSAGIQSGATGTGMWPGLPGVVMSQRCSGTQSSINVTVADAAYSSGGTLYLDASQRTGDGIYFDTSETTYCTECFAYGHYVGFHLSTAAAWISLVVPTVDENNALNDPNTVGILIDGSSNGSSIQGGSTQAAGRSVVVNTTGNGPHSIMGMQLNNSNVGAVIEVDQGSATFIGNSSPFGSHNTLVGGGVTNLVAFGNNLGNSPVFQNPTARAHYAGLGNVQPANTYTGTLTLAGTTILGAGGAGVVCGDLMASCGTTSQGAWFDGTTSFKPLASGGSLAVSGDQRTVIMQGSAAVSTFTLTLPGIGGTGQEFEIYFPQAVTTLTVSASPASVGMPTSIAANTWHKCKAISPTWYCQ